MAKCSTNIILRTNKQNGLGQKPITVTISVANQLKKLSTGVSVFPEQWDSNSKEVLFINKKNAKSLLLDIDHDLLPTLEEKTKTINNDLKAIIGNIEKIVQRFNLDNVDFSSSMVVDEYKRIHLNNGKKEEAKNLVFDYTDKYIEDNTASRVKGSLSVYKVLKETSAGLRKGKKH